MINKRIQEKRLALQLSMDIDVFGPLQIRLLRA